MKELITEISHINSSKKECRKFGYSVGSVLLIIGLTLLYFGKSSAVYFLSIAGILILLGFILPASLKPLQKIWMGISVILGSIMTRVILTFLFYIVVTPVAIIAKIAGKDFLNLKIEKEKKSYWIFRDKKEYNKTETEKQF